MWWGYGWDCLMIVGCGVGCFYYWFFITNFLLFVIWVFLTFNLECYIILCLKLKRIIKRKWQSRINFDIFLIVLRKNIQKCDFLWCKWTFYWLWLLLIIFILVHLVLIFILVAINLCACVVFSLYLLVSAKTEGFFNVLFRYVFQFFKALVTALVFELVFLLWFRNLQRLS